MKSIEIDEELYQYIASHTQHIGESASQILRRMLKLDANQPAVPVESPSRKRRSPRATTSADARLQSVHNLLSSPGYTRQKLTIYRFLQLLSVLYQIDSVAFSAAADSVHGRSRVYFAKDEETLLLHGKQTQPRQVPETPYWVITNTNSGRKCAMVERIMLMMHFPEDLITEVCATI